MNRIHVAAQKCLIGFLGLTLLWVPYNLFAECKVTLNWSNNGGQPTGYRLFERKTSEAYNENQYYDMGSQTACTIYGLQENSTYHFVVRAYGQDNESENSNEATYVCNAGSSSSDDANPPAVPTLISPADTAQSVSLEPLLTTADFSDADPDDGHAQTRWQIFRLDNDQCIYDVVSYSDLTSVKVPPSTLAPFTAYYWTATHYSGKGGISEPAPASDFTTTSADADDKSLTSSSLGANSSNSGGGGGGSSNGFFSVGCFIQTLLDD
jgi:hypothetical protein